MVVSFMQTFRAKDNLLYVLKWVFIQTAKPPATKYVFFLQSLNLTYDNHGRLLSWTYGDLHILHVYDGKTGYLTEKKIGTRAVYRFIYKSGTKVSLQSEFPINVHAHQNKIGTGWLPTC